MGRIAARELANRLKDSGITVNAVSPGYFVGTNIFHHMRGIMQLGIRLIRPLLANPEHSAQTYVFLASSPDVEGITGKYWKYCKEKITSRASHDKTLQNRTIRFTESALGLNQPTHEPDN